jgi:hypothetical protein
MRHGSGQGSSKRGWWIALLALLALLVVGRLVAPAIIERVVTKSLHQLSDGYVGDIDHIDVRMLSAEIALVELRVRKENGLVPVPFMQARELVIGTVMDSWKPRSTLRVVSPVVSVVDGPNEAKSQTGPTFKLEDLRRQLPFELVSLVVEDGEFHFRNFEGKPDLDVYAKDLDVTWDKLFGCLPPGSSACHSELRADAVLLERGKLVAKGQFERNPKARLHADITVRDLPAAQLSPVLKRYAKVDVQKGEIDLDVRYDRRGKSQTALIVPKLSNLEVRGGDGEKTSFFREVGLAAAAGWFERKKGEKAVRFSSAGPGDSSFELIDLKPKSAGGKTD